MKWVLAVMILAASSVAVNVGDWSGEINVDTMTDAKTVVMSTYDAVALLGTLLLGTDVPPEFMVVFSEGDDVPLIGIDFSKYIGSSGYSTCLVRIDDKPAVEYQVAIEDGKMLFIIGSYFETKEFFANLLRGNEFLIRFRPAGQSQINTSFSLSGITGLAGQLGIDVDYYLNLAEPQTLRYRQPEPVPRILRPVSSDTWVTGSSQQVRWANLQGSEVTVNLLDDLGRRMNLGTFANSGSARVVIGNDFPDSEFCQIEITDETGSVYKSNSFRVTHVLLESPFHSSALPRVLNKRIEWHADAEEARVSLWFDDDEIIELTNGWITSSENSAMVDLILPDSLPPSGNYRIAIQVRDMNGTEHIDFSRSYSLTPSDNTIEGAIKLDLGANNGAIEYSGDIDYWQINGATHRRFDFEIEGSGQYRLILLSQSGEILKETTGSNLWWEANGIGTLYLVVRDKNNAASGMYNINIRRTVLAPPEPHRMFGVSMGADYLLIDTLDYFGYHGEALFSPIKFTDFGLGLHILSQNGCSFKYINGRVGLCTPRLLGMQLLGGASYDFRISKPDDYWFEHGYVFDDSLLESGFRPFIGLDALVSNNPSGYRTSVRANAHFAGNSLHRMSAGLYFYK